MPGRFQQSGWTLAFMKILLVFFDFALWVFYIIDAVVTSLDIQYTLFHFYRYLDVLF